MYTHDNKICVQVDTDIEGRKFMNVHKPVIAIVTIQSDNSVVINVNESCIFRIGNAHELHVFDNRIS